MKIFDHSINSSIISQLQYREGRSTSCQPHRPPETRGNEDLEKNRGNKEAGGRRPAPESKKRGEGLEENVHGDAGARAVNRPSAISGYDEVVEDARNEKDKGCHLAAQKGGGQARQVRVRAAQELI